MTDVGQGDAIAMYNAAVSGTLKIDPLVAQVCASHCAELAGMFADQAVAAADLSHSSGFGGFASSHELQSGFGRKGQEAVDMIHAYREAAFRFEAAFLAAGQLFEEADAANSRALASIQPSST
ncbi:hypothetical protein [Antrihabitans cavernicola]|uniref:Uncharacterized protein n=1 Tax=Antrihabitans cavernicola TaxID=2495913 RepID=A0A5A7SGM1_9NOCA|nr:hypothetical protein [Spelaeibacter cavernicola]KAA0024986.1 hypothetical protein FOY51_03480 [Spelaeibacter cavernicola]